MSKQATLQAQAFDILYATDSYEPTRLAIEILRIIESRIDPPKAGDQVVCITLDELEKTALKAFYAGVYSGQFTEEANQFKRNRNIKKSDLQEA